MQAFLKQQQESKRLREEYAKMAMQRDADVDDSEERAKERSLK